MPETFVLNDSDIENETAHNSRLIERKENQLLQVNVLGQEPTTTITNRRLLILPVIAVSRTAKEKGVGFFSKVAFLSALINRRSKSINRGSRRVPEKNILLDKAKELNLTEVTPLEALQVGIERVNLESKDPFRFKTTLAQKLFSKTGVSIEQVDALWENSIERKIILEIYSQMNLLSDVGRPITFRDAFNRAYESKKDSERIALDRIAKALILNL